jgi:dTDP-glucose 4,6-dehydratase
MKTVEWYLDNPDWIEAVVSGSYKEYYKKQYTD